MADRNPSISAVGFLDDVVPGSNDADLMNDTVAAIGATGLAQMVTTMAEVAAPNVALGTAPDSAPDTASNSAASSAHAPTLSAHAPRSST